MDFNIDIWLFEIIEKLKDEFQNNLLFVGLQGSYGRNEATEESDIDLVVILNELKFKDLKIYRNILDKMPYKEKACGFILGRKEIENWSKEDLFQFFYDTKDLYGKLNEIISPPALCDIKKAIKSGFENIYHFAVHSFLHSENLAENLAGLLKPLFFVLQAKHFVESGVYIRTKNELVKKLKEPERSLFKKLLYCDFAQPKEQEDLYKSLIILCKENM